LFNIFSEGLRKLQTQKLGLNKNFQFANKFDCKISLFYETILVTKNI